MVIEGFDRPRYDIYSARRSDSWDRWVDSHPRPRTYNASYAHADIEGIDDLDMYGHWEQIPDHGWAWSTYTGECGLAALCRRPLGLARPVGLDLGVRRALGLGAVPLRTLGLHPSTLVLGSHHPTPATAGTHPRSWPSSAEDRDGLPPSPSVAAA